MNSIKKDSSKYNPERQLELLKLQCNKLSSEIYQNKQKYLELIRTTLPEAIHQAVFLLITEYSPNVLASSSLDSRKLCLKEIDKLVSKYLALITIDKLMELSNELERENRSKALQSQKNLFNSLHLNNEQSDLIDPLDHQSINISSNIPLDDPTRIEGSCFNKNNLLKEDISLDVSKDDLFQKYWKKNVSLSDKKDNTSIQEKDNFGLDGLKKLFEMAGKRFNQDNTKNNSSKDKSQSNSSPLGNISEQSLLPQNPLEIIKSLNSLDDALTRRLRNLSNSINLELLSTGLINNLIPVSLLDSVLLGQLNTKDAPSNLLRLNMPINESISDDFIDIVCLLIRLSELEFDYPQLRKCRSLLTHHQNLLLKMSSQYQYWQSRALAEEVSQQWFQNPSTIKKTIVPKG